MAVPRRTRCRFPIPPRCSRCRTHRASCSSATSRACRANVEVGEFTYYDDPAGPDAFLANIRYHFEFRGDRLRIGRYCAIATGATFVMNGGNHRTSGISTFPFPIFEQWRGKWDGEFDFPTRGDTVIGNDVWIGHDALVMPGVSVGDGAIIATRSVVTRDVPPYAIVGGNPAQVIRTRFDEPTIERLLRIAWWDWPRRTG